MKISFNWVRTSEVRTLYVPLHETSLTSKKERWTATGTNYPVNANCKDLCISLWGSWHWSLMRIRPADPIWPFCNFQLQSWATTFLFVCLFLTANVTLHVPTCWNFSMCVCRCSHLQCAQNWVCLQVRVWQKSKGKPGKKGCGHTFKREAVYLFVSLKMEIWFPPPMHRQLTSVYSPKSQQQFIFSQVLNFNKACFSRGM